MTDEIPKSEIVSSSDVGSRITDYWVDTVIDSMPYEFFKIEKTGNRIVIYPVEIVEIKEIP